MGIVSSSLVHDYLDLDRYPDFSSVSPQWIKKNKTNKKQTKKNNGSVLYFHTHNYQDIYIQIRWSVLE